MRPFTVGSSEVRRSERLAQLVLGLHSYHGVQVLCKWVKKSQTFTLYVIGTVLSVPCTADEWKLLDLLKVPRCSCVTQRGINIRKGFHLINTNEAQKYKDSNKQNHFF